MAIGRDIALIGQGTELVSLPQYEGGDDKQIAVAEWEKASKAEIMVQLYKGAIVCSLVTTFGEGVRQEFARETGDSYSTIKDYGSVYARLLRLSEVDQSTILNMLHRSHLTYTHVLRATPVEDNEDFMDLLVQAHDENWSVKRLTEERAAISTPSPAAIDAAPATTEYIEEDFDNDAADAVLAEMPYEYAEGFEGGIREAIQEGQSGRFLFIDRGNDLDLDEPWEALFDALTGEIIVYLENVKSIDTFKELVNLANGRS